MLDDITVDARIAVRHPEITEDDVKSAWNNAIVYAERIANDYGIPLLVAIGSDSHGRLLEIVAVVEGTTIRAFHAMTPPSKKTLAELGVK